MYRHIVDTDRHNTKGGRLAAYLKAERESAPNRASLLLQRRSRKGRMRPELKQFLRIERGHFA